MCGHLVTGHAISVLNHCLSGISSLTLTYTTPDSGLTYIVNVKLKNSQSKASPLTKITNMPLNCQTAVGVVTLLLLLFVILVVGCKLLAIFYLCIDTVLCIGLYLAYFVPLKEAIELRNCYTYTPAFLYSVSGLY